MNSIYTLRSTPAPGEFLIHKLDRDFNPEATYALSTNTCTCPSGVRSTCRHRKMLALFKREGHIDDGFFLEWETRLWAPPLVPVEPPAPPATTTAVPAVEPRSAPASSGAGGSPTGAVKIKRRKF